MKKEKKNRCLVEVSGKQIKGTIIKEYEEIGGPDDGARFAIIDLDNGQEITIKMSEVSKDDD